MAKAPPSAKRDRIKNFTPALVDYTNDVVYGDLWERKGLSKRDRSLITVAALVATFSASGGVDSAAHFSTGYSAAMKLAALLSLLGAVAGLWLPARQRVAAAPTAQNA